MFCVPQKFCNDMRDDMHIWQTCCFWSFQSQKCPTNQSKVGRVWGHQEEVCKWHCWFSPQSTKTAFHRCPAHREMMKTLYWSILELKWNSNWNYIQLNNLYKGISAIHCLCGGQRFRHTLPVGHQRALCQAHIQGIWGHLQKNQIYGLECAARRQNWFLKYFFELPLITVQPFWNV